MIRINLLAVERGRAKRRFGIDLGQRVTLACGGISVAVVVIMAWQGLALRREMAGLDVQLRSIDGELATLSDVVVRRNEFETQGAELARRVALIEELREGQGGPVRMLDQVSRALPAGVWLTEMRQEDADLTILGRSTSLSVLSDLVIALERSGYFVLPVTVVDSQLESQAGADVVRFELRAEFRLPPS